MSFAKPGVGEAPLPQDRAHYLYKVLINVARVNVTGAVCPLKCGSCVMEGAGLVVQ